MGNLQIGDRIGAYRITALAVNGYQAIRGEALDDHAVQIEVWSGEGTHVGAKIAEAAQMLGAINHPGIAQIVDYGMLDDGTPWMACEHANRTSGHDLLAGALRADKVAELIRSIAEVLRFAHAEGVVHGRLRPHSIERTAHDCVAISGWGISDRRPRTAYDAPESTVTAKSDIYALGIIAFRALTGHLPSGGLTLHVPGAPPALAKLVAEMAAPDPARRPSAADVREAMGENAPVDVIALDEIDDSDFASEVVPAFLELAEPTRLPRPRWTPATHLAPVLAPDRPPAATRATS